MVCVRQAAAEALPPSQDEHFEVLEGTLRARVDDEQRDLGPGDAIDIPRGSAHQIWNPGTEPARAIWQTRPGGRTKQWFAAIDALHREGRVGDDGMPGPLAFAVLLSEYDDVFPPRRPRRAGRARGAVCARRGRPSRGYTAKPA